ncbi:hypothetical protein BDV24DRAFT_169538 [Aspergillus arachidicola]|uniref:Uncharacterized protein n=1 Tax=Aspergillus arachidicola TaxID=656916 RepID=A0A5N6XPG8_9EURO|nr:hypothetical protein BDV24DRAFT_169538 [Aspergillus arachidicola]
MASGQDDDAGIDFELYRYTPSLAAAVIFIVLFAIPRLCIYIKSSGHIAVQIIGYVCRALAHDDKESIPLYSVGTIIILLGPPLYVSSIYMTLGRLIRHLDVEHLSLVSVKWLTKIFATGE